MFTSSEPQPQQSPSSLYQSINPSIPPDDINAEYNLLFYTELLTSPFMDLNELSSQEVQETPFEENVVVGLPTNVLGPFSENEDEILLQHAQDEEDSPPLQNNPPSLPHLSHSQPLSIYNPPQHFLDFPTNINNYDTEFIHVPDREMVVYPPRTLFVGQHFATKEQVQDAINRYHIVHHCTYKGSRMISQTILEIIEADPSTPISTIIAHIKTTMGYTINYRKEWLGKQHTIERIYKNWEQSYHKLPAMLKAMQMYLPGFILKMNTQPAYREFSYTLRVWSGAVAHLVTITTRILAAADMQAELNELHELLLSSHPHHMAHSSILSMVRVLAHSPHIDQAHSHFNSLRAQFPPPSLPLPFYNLLLRSALRRNRPDLATSLYADMLAARLPPQTYTFNLLIHSLCSSRALDLALQLFDKMPLKGCPPNHFTLAILVRGLCRAGLAKQALRLLHDDAFSHIANRVVYNTLVSCLCREDMIDEAEKLVERMTQKGVLPDVVTFNSRISALCQAGKVLEASRIFRDMQMDQALGLPRPNVVTFNLMLKGFCKHGMLEDARGLVDIMKKVGNFVSLESYNIWLLGLLRNGDFLEARLVLDEMAAKGIGPNAYTYNIIMDGLCRNGMLSDARGLMDLMISNGVYPDTVTYSTLLHGYCSKGKVFEAKSVLREMIRNGCQPNTYTCNTLLHSLWKEGRTLEAEEMLQKMNEKCYQPDTVTCNIVVNGLCRNGELDKAIEIVSGMWTNGTTSLDKGNSFANLINSIGNVSNCLPDGITYTTLINGLCKDGRIDEAKKRFIEMTAKNLHPDSATYDTFIRSFCKQGKISSAFRVLKDMERNGCSKTLQTYNALILGLGNKKQIFEMYGLMDEMREKGINPDICTYNNIISCLCEGEKAKDAISLLHEMLDKGISPNMSSFKILIKAFCKSDDFKVACELFEVALSICGHKEALYSLMFNELLTGGKLSEAKELFEASLDRYLALKNFMYKDLIERLCQDARLADANSLLHKLIDKGYGFDHASFMPVIDGLNKRGDKQQADELATRMMEFALEDRIDDRTYQSRTRIIHGKLHKDGESDWHDIVNRDSGSGIALKTLKRVQKGWGQGSISNLQSQQNDSLDYYE
ncbi:hypothetical protein Fmac_005214 [Flemingia macrophylla]|uniref:Pentatricopeptide repeat-containing protein n=1 Tax=Flemingia macrophylla TaxID=520843 RepID=A0ABD1N747_9FABA